MHENDEKELMYVVVLNDEEQYSIWPEHKAMPPGWRDIGVRGAKADCLSHIDTVWTDMRPLSLRRQMAAANADTESGRHGR